MQESFSIQMKYRLKINGNRAIIGICFHNIRHKIPPFPVDWRISRFPPFFKVIYFNITK